MPLDPEFDRRIRALVTAGQSGGKSLNFESVYRSPQDQARAINSVSMNVNKRPASIVDYARGIPGYAAPVGSSMHQKGLAADLAGGGVGWARENAANYGIRFPESLRGTDPNHAEIDPKFWGPVQDPRDAAATAAAASAPPIKVAEIPARMGGTDVAPASTSSPAPSAARVASYSNSTGAAPAMAQSYSGWTPESVDFAKKFGAGQMKEGIDSSPVGHWTQAIARVLQAGSGAAWNQQGMEAERAGNAGVADIYSKGLSSGTPVKQIAAQLMGNPFGANEGQGIAKAVIANEVKGPEQTPLQKDYKYAQGQGFTGTMMDFDKQRREASRTQVNIDQKGETSFASESAKSLVKRLTDNVEQGQAARTQQGDLERLLELGNAIGTQGAAASVKAALGPYANALGIQIEGLNEIQAFTGIVSKLAPTMRPPGSGATSDFEFKQYVAALPQLAQTTEGRKLILDQMGAMINHKAAVGEISERVLAGEIDRKQADVEIRKLGNPLSLWRKGPQALPPSAPAAPQQPGQAPIVQMGNQIADQVKQQVQAGQRDPAAVVARLKAQLPPEKVAQALQMLGLPVPPDLMAQPQAAPAPQQPQMRGKLNYRPQGVMPNG